MKHVKNRLIKSHKIQNYLLFVVSVLHPCCVFMVRVLFYFSFACLFVYASIFKSKVHCGSAVQS